MGTSVAVAAAGLAMALASGCLNPELTMCDDGRACSHELLCDDVHATCVTPAQAVICTGLTDGDRCDADGFQGLCDLGYCISGCGDGVQDPGEQCDDGDHQSHDGCSSQCLVETPSWVQWRSPWRPLAIASMATWTRSDPMLAELHLFGGVDPASGNTNAHWIGRETATGLTWQRFISPTMPSPRASAMMAYLPDVADPDHGRLVLFGGVDTAALNDTWEFDGTTWTKRDFGAEVQPRVRFDAGLVYDANRHTLVLVGGTTVGGRVAGDELVWEYDGAHWTRVVTSGLAGGEWFSSAVAYDHNTGLIVALDVNGPTCELDPGAKTWTEATFPSGPAARRLAVMVDHLGLDKLVLYGGLRTQQAGPSLSDTWMYQHGVGWTTDPATATSDPGGRYQAAATYSATRGLVLMGGLHSTSNPIPDADVWALDKFATWSALDPRFTPSPRVVQLAYDEHRGEAVLLEGFGAASVGDTWLFGENAWSGYAAPYGVSGPHYGACTTYDPVQRRVLAFGGSLPNGALTADLRAWDGDSRTWTEIPPTPSSPSPRSNCALAYDRARETLVLYGGTSSDASTWELHGQEWRRVDTAGPTPDPIAVAMAYDAARQRIVAYTTADTVWEYRDDAWTPAATGPGPKAGLGSRLVYDPRRRVLVVYGGDSFDPRPWELDGDQWTVVITADGDVPEPRKSAGVVALDSARSLLVFGGAQTANSLLANDTWLLQYRSTSPDEVCANGTDDDGDHRIDADDPDCY